MSSRKLESYRAYQMTEEQKMGIKFPEKPWQEGYTREQAQYLIDNPDEVIVAFRNAYEGGPDNRTLDGMIAEINWYAEEIINKVK